MSQGEYTRSVVAFIDILGFTALIRSGEVTRAFKVLADVRDRQMRVHRLGSLNQGMKISMFSDSVLISTPIHPGGDHQARVVTSYCENLFLSLLEEGVSCRGSIVIGNVYHEDPVAFGPAIISAYVREQEAIYPRIIVDDEVCEMAVAAEANRGAWAIRDEHMFKKDKDGRKYLRMFTPWANTPWLGTGLTKNVLHARFRNAVERMLEPAIDARVRQKLVWLLADLAEDEADFGNVRITGKVEQPN